MSRSRRRPWWHPAALALASLVAVALMGSIALAHGLQLTGQRVSEALVGHADYGASNGPEGVRVEARRQAGGPIAAEARTGPGGAFRLPWPAGADAVLVTVDDGSGHRAHLLVPASGEQVTTAKPDAWWKGLIAGLAIIAMLALIPIAVRSGGHI